MNNLELLKGIVAYIQSKQHKSPAACDKNIYAASDTKAVEKSPPENSGLSAAKNKMNV